MNQILKKKTLVITITIIFILLSLSSLAATGEKLTNLKSSSNTIVVYPGNSIQDAINKAKAGDTVYVKNGIYNENLKIRTSITLEGENKLNTIIDGRAVGTVIKVYADDVTIKGFTLKNCNSQDLNAVITLYSSYNLIRNNIITDEKVDINWGRIGIKLDSLAYDPTRFNLIDGNDISKFPIGIYAVNTWGNTISNNVIHHANGVGILDNEEYKYAFNSYVGNKVFNCNGSGFMIETNQNIIKNNEIYNNGEESNEFHVSGVDGIKCYGDLNIIEGNDIYDNFGEGISFQDRYDQFGLVEKNLIRNNNIFNNNKSGITLEGANNEIYENNVYKNKHNIYVLEETENNFIYYNNFYDAVECNFGCKDELTPHESDYHYNIWDDGTDGNYWDDYETRYPDAEYNGSSGSASDKASTWDTSYRIAGQYDAYSQDDCPWIEPNGDEVDYEEKVKTLGFPRLMNLFGRILNRFPILSTFL